MPPSVVLRDVTADDVPTFFEHQDDSVIREMSVIPHWPREEFLARWAKHLVNNSGCKQAIWADGQLVGSILSFDRDGLRQVGYVIGRAHWGKGIATEALRQFLRLEPTRPLSAVVSAHNPASCKVAQKCGFVLSGELAEEEGKRGRAMVLTLAAVS